MNMVWFPNRISIKFGDIPVGLATLKVGPINLVEPT
jgi:hypothetical protein